MSVLNDILSWYAMHSHLVLNLPFHQRRTDISGTNGIDGNAVLGDFQRQGFCKPNDAVFSDVEI